MHMATEGDYRTTLRTHGLRATAPRVSLLDALTCADRPMSVTELLEVVGESQIDKVTIYRTLDSFITAGIAQQIDLRHGHACFELRHDGEEHHHITCTNCNYVANVPGCNTARLEQRILAHAKDFSTITEHSIEYFGLCKKCARGKDG